MPCKNRSRLALQQLFLALLALALWGTLLCQKVEVSQDPSLDLSALRTFGFEQATRSVTDPFSEHPQAEQWVRQALREGLRELGYAESDSEEPGFRIRISGEAQLKERQVETGRVYIKHVEQFVEATLKVEFIETDSGKAVWTGIASDRAYVQRKGVDITPKKARQKIQKAVLKMIQRLKRLSQKSSLPKKRSSSGAPPGRIMLGEPVPVVAPERLHRRLISTTPPGSADGRVSSLCPGHNHRIVKGLSAPEEPWTLAGGRAAPAAKPPGKAAKRTAPWKGLERTLPIHSPPQDASDSPPLPTLTAS